MSNKGLQKTLGFSAALSTVVGMVIGGGVFFKPQAIYSATGGAPGLGMLAWVIAGVITTVIRLYGGYPEGVSYSILFVNVMTPLIDKYTKTKVFGEVAK